jgi:RNA polymerase sigma factor (sigma-70 family)
MTLHNPTDSDLIAAIQGTSEQRMNALKTLFQSGIWQQIVVRYVEQHGGTTQDGKDVFQETMILFDRNIRAKAFDGRASLQTYFVGIAKWYWLGVQRKKNKFVELDTAEHIKGEGQSAEFSVISEERKDLLDKAIAQLGERCQKILGLYKLDYSMKEAAEVLSLSSAELAKKHASECRKKLREYLEARPELLKILRG